MYTLITIIAVAILIYFIILGVAYTYLLLISFRNTYNNFLIAERSNSAMLINQNDLVPVTVIMATYNAEARILDSALSVLQSDYKNLNFILVNDGSTDKTLDILHEKFGLYAVAPTIKQTFKTAPIIGCYKSKIYPNLFVIDKEHSGSADTVQMGLNACQTPLYITIDADTLVMPASISNMIFTYLSYRHNLVVGGAIYLLNECKVEKGKVVDKRVPYNFICALQSCEYIRSFLYGRSGWENYGGALCYPSAFTLYETQAVKDVGGYDTKNYSYDVDIILKLNSYMARNKYPFSIHYSPNAIAFTECPSTLGSYWKQRNHWQRGMLRSVTSHMNMLFNPKYKSVGLFNFPFYIAFEIFGYVVEFISYILVFLCWYLDIFNVYAIVLFIILAWAYSAFLSAACVLINTLTFNVYRNFIDILNMLSMTVIQMIGFRQYNALCCFVATIQYGINRLLGKPQ